MSTLPDRPTDLKPFRTLSGALAVTVIFAVLEVLVRFLGYEQVVHAEQLALAAFANVGAAGAIVVVTVAAAWAVGGLLGLVVRRHRSMIKRICIAAAFAMAASVLFYATETFGLSRRWETPWSRPLFAALAVIVATLGVWELGLSGRPSLMNLTRGLVVIGWTACFVGAGVSALKTGQYVSAWTAPVIQEQPPASEELPNILLVVIDTLRADVVSGPEGAQLAPNLAELAQSSVSFTSALSTAPWTLPAHASLLTGLYPEEHGVNWGHYRLRDNVPVLPELLRARGYESWAISNNHLLSKKNGFARGFERFLDTSRDPYLSRWRLALRCAAVQRLSRWFGLSDDAGWDQGAAVTNWVLEKFLGARSQTRQPFFGLVNYFEPHDPYSPPRRYLEKLLTPKERAAYHRLHQSEEKLAACACGVPDVFTPEQVELMRRLYNAEVAYVDERVGQLVSALKRYGRFDNTLLVITSDHGELFGEWNMLYHTASAHYRLLHVPLIVRPPHGVEARLVDSPVQPVDVFATMARAGGAEVPASVRQAFPLPMAPEDAPQRKVSVAQTHAASIAGLSIAQRVDQQADLSNWLRWVNVIFADGYLLETDSTGKRSLYEVVRDPGMTSDLFAARPDVARSLEQLLEAWTTGGSAVAEEHPKKPEPKAVQVRATECDDVLQRFFLP